MRRRLTIGLLLLLIATLAAPGASGGSVAMRDHLGDHGFNEDQIDATLNNAWNLTGRTQMYGFGDDPLSEPGVGAEDAAGTVPISIGVEYVRFTDQAFLPPSVTQPTVMEDGNLLIPFGSGGLELNRLYVWFWAEMEGDIPWDQPGIELNISWPSYVTGAERWQSSFLGDSWTGASHVPFFYNDPTTADPLDWFAGLSFVDGGSLRSYEGSGGLAWLGGSLAGMYVPADAFMRAATQHIAEYGYAADITLNPRFRFDPEAPRKVTVFPANFTAEGRQGGLEPIVREGRFTINVGFLEYVDPIRARLLRAPDGGLFANLTFLDPWPTEATIDYFLEMFDSMGLQWALVVPGLPGPFFGLEFHLLQYSAYGSGPDGELTPDFTYVMNDGSLNVDLGIDSADIPEGTQRLDLFTVSAFWLDTETTERQFIETPFEFTPEEIEDGDPTGDGQTTYPEFDLVTGQELDPPATATTATSTSTTSTTTQPATATETTGAESTTTTTLGRTTERDRTTTTTGLTTGEACWWCWGVVLLFLVFLLSVLYIWLKTYEWWTCWLPWFIVIFAWVPFLLAGLWWWRPAWWWVPLLAWFPLVWGYTWYWARHRRWWRPWHLYVVGTYLIALAVGMVVVGAPEWGLLFPLFWAPWVVFYVWFRGARQPWFQPWMWLLFAGYLVWGFVWVAALTPWWAWWLPVAFVLVAGWWFVHHGYGWRVIHGPKWCWIAPFALLPFFAWWIPLWGPWWCFVIILFLAVSILCAVFNHFVEEEWWTCWMPWALILWIGVPFLLAGLWFFGPNWWWLPLLGWFVVLPGLAWWWARRRHWWRPWHWYALFGYLAVAAVLMYLVGSPTWGLLFPVFWLVPLVFWVWYRPRRQPWFQPWMWLLFAGYVGWVFAWVIWLTPFWGWWFPIFFVPFFGWWGVSHGYDSRLFARKATAVIPIGLLPWLGYMLAVYCIPAYYM